MATAVSPTTGGELGKIRSFLLDHEKLLIVFILAVVCWWGYGKYAQIRLDHDSAALKQAQIVTAAQVQANQQLLAQVAAAKAQSDQDKADLKALNDKVTAQNQQLVAANTALATALAKQQQTDATMPIPDLINRWAQLVPGTNFDGAMVSTGANVMVTPSNARATVEQLEKVPVLTQELANETTQKQNDDQVIVAQNKSIADLNTQVTALNASLVGAQKLDADHQAQAVDEIKVVKDQARKSKRRWFVIGFVSGLVAGHYFGF